MGVSKTFREIKKLAESVGIDNPKIHYPHGKGHPILTGFANGKEIETIVSGTPSDFRGNRILKAKFKRLVKETA